MKTKSIKNKNVQVSERLIKSLKRYKELVVTDRKLFQSFGVEVDKINFYESRVRKFDALLKDDGLNELLKEKRILLRNQRKDLLQRIQLLSSMITAVCNKEQSLIKLNYLSKGNLVSNTELANIGRIVLLFAHNHKNELRAFGLSDENLFDLSQAIMNITVLNAEIEVYKIELVLRKAKIKGLAIELVEQTKFFARIGRSIWARKDIERWNSYRIPNFIYRAADVDIG
jgi:hypothetical protein